MSTKQIYGPVVSTSQVYVFTFYENQWYILKSDPNLSISTPYFGVNQALQDDPIYLFTLQSTNGVYRMLTKGNLGVQAGDPYAYLSIDSDGTIEYTYVANDITVGTGLYNGENVKLYNSQYQPFIFPIKNIVNEQADRDNYQSPEYKPTYNGMTDVIFFVQYITYNSDSSNPNSSKCGKWENYAFLMFSTQGIYQGNTFSILDYCENDITYSLCTQGYLCGQQVDPCVGPCQSGLECLSFGGDLQCRDPDSEDVQPWYTSWWFVALIVLIIIIVLGVLLYVVYKVSKPPPPKSNIYYYR